MVGLNSGNGFELKGRKTMSKKTVSVLLLIILTLAVALFSFTSCKNEVTPAPTRAPEPGDIPTVPSEATTISRLSSEQQTIIETIFSDISDFFVEYTDDFEVENTVPPKPLYKLMNDPQLSFDKEISFSANAASGTFDANQYEHGDITGFIGIGTYVENEKEEEDVCLFADAVVTMPLFNWTEKSIHVEYFLYGSDDIRIFIDRDDYDGTPDLRYDGKNRDFYENGTKVTNAEDKALLQKQIDFLLFAGMKALSGVTIDFSNITITDKLENNNDNLATFTLEGQVQLSGTLLENITTYDSHDTDFSIDEFYSSFSATVPSLRVQAAVATKTEDASELMAATLYVENLSLSAIYDEDDTTTTVSADKLSLTLSNGNSYMVLSLNLSDLDFMMVLGGGMDLDASFTLGLGLKAGENSAGLLTDFDITIGKVTGMPYISFNPKASVINGLFYSTSDTKDILIDYFDQLLLMFTKTFRT